MAQKLNVNTSIVDYLKSIGKDSSFSARAKMAVELGIVKDVKDYKGTAQQNTSLLKQAKASVNNKQADKPKADTKAKGNTKTDTPKADDSALLKDNVDTNVTTGTDTTATDWADLYNQIVQGVTPGGEFTYEKAPLLDAIRPEFRTSADLAEVTGLNYDYNTIYDLLMRSVDAAHAARKVAQDASDAEYYTNAAAAQSTLAESLAQQQSQAIQTGTNRGMQAANALSSVLGVSQQFAGGASQLAQQRAQLGKDYAQQQAQAGVNAMNQSTDVAKYLADISKNIYSADSSSYVGQLDYNASSNAANAQLGAQKMATQSALAGNFADIMQGYYSGQISLEQARIASNAQIESAKQYGVDAATINAASQEAVANISKRATEYASDRNYDSTVYMADRNYDTAETTANRSYDATVYNADTSANVQREQMSGAAITGLISSFNEGLMEGSEAMSALDGYRAMGMINDDTYNTIANIFQPAPVVVPQPETKPKNKKVTNRDTSWLTPEMQRSLDTPGSALNTFDAGITKAQDWVTMIMDKLTGVKGRGY